MQKNPTIEDLIQKAGGITALAWALGCSRTIIHKWNRNAELQQPWLDALRYRKPEWFI